MTFLPSFVFIDDSSIEFSLTENIIRTQMDSGVEKIKQKDSIATFNLSFVVSIHREDFKSFYDWYNNDLRFGAFWFLMSHPLTGESVRVRFRQNFSWRKLGNLMTSSFVIEGYYV